MFYLSQFNPKKEGNSNGKVLLLLSVFLFALSVTQPVIAAVSQDNPALSNLQAKPDEPAVQFI